ncbi:MAG: DUF3298 domain-containing protein [Lewinellaceae bacterium]|nr:DUF3298 domain-containing protein [Lewinellaceae bacterium]
MKNLSFILAGIFLLALVFSCKNEPKTPATTVVVNPLRYEKTHGTDCEKPDSLRNNCLKINLVWPDATGGSDALRKNVAAWANTYITGMLTPGSTDSAAAATTVEAAAQAFIEEHKTFSIEAPDSPLGQWVAESKDTTLLNDGKYLTLEIAGYTFSGGAHGSPTAAVATFETGTGKQIGWDDLVTDKTALKTRAEKKYREIKDNIFKDGFEFDDTFRFDLPANFGLVQDGIYFHYLHYEVGPYAIGNTTFVLPFSELDEILKIGK